MEELRPSKVNFRLLNNTTSIVLTLKAGFHAGVAVGAVGGEAGAVGKDETVLLLLQVGEPGAGRGLQTQLSTLLLSFRICE